MVVNRRGWTWTMKVIHGSRPRSCPGWMGHKVRNKERLFERWNRRTEKNHRAWKACQLYWVLHPKEIVR